MFPAKIYIGQVVVVCAIVLAAIWGATQWAAMALGHQAALGPAWFVVAGYPIYLPWRLFEWWYAYDAYAPHVFERAGTLAASGGAAGALFAVLNSVWRARQNQLVTTFGSARWATPPGLREITRRGPYMHNGSVATLEGVVEHYVKGGIDRPSRSALMNPVALTAQEQSEMVAFLKTLTSSLDPTSVPVLPR